MTKEQLLYKLADKINELHKIKEVIKFIKDIYDLENLDQFSDEAILIKNIEYDIENLKQKYNNWVGN